jgi:AraC-like DNA-binding protein
MTTAKQPQQLAAIPQIADREANQPQAFDGGLPTMNELSPRDVAALIASTDSNDDVQGKLKGAKSQLYFVRDLGHIYTYTAYPKAALAPFCSVLHLSLTRESLTVKLDGVNYVRPVILGAPAVTEIDARNNPTLAFVFQSLAPVSMAIRAIAKPKVLLPSRELFAHLDKRLLQTMRGELTSDEARQLFLEVSDILLAALPPPPQFDERIAVVMQKLRENLECPLPVLAKAIALSEDRLTHLFSEVMGTSIRRFRLAIKVHRAIVLYKPGMTLTAIAQGAGFSDSAHMSRACRELNGAAPTYYIANTTIHLA